MVERSVIYNSWNGSSNGDWGLWMNNCKCSACGSFPTCYFEISTLAVVSPSDSYSSRSIDSAYCPSASSDETCDWTSQSISEMARISVGTCDAMG